MCEIARRAKDSIENTSVRPAAHLLPAFGERKRVSWCFLCLRRTGGETDCCVTSSTVWMARAVPIVGAAQAWPNVKATLETEDEKGARADFPLSS